MINKEQEKLDERKEKDHKNGKHWKWQTWVCSNAGASSSNEISERKKKKKGWEREGETERGFNDNSVCDWGGEMVQLVDVRVPTSKHVQVCMIYRQALVARTGYSEIFRIQWWTRQPW